MKNKFILCSVGASLAFSCGLIAQNEAPAKPAKPPVQKDKNAEWFTNALKGKTSTPAPSKVLTAEEVTNTLPQLLASYKKAAITQGWDKQLMKNPPVFDGKGRPKVSAAILEQDGKKMPYTIIVRGEKPKNGYPLFISMHGGGKYHGEEKVGPHGWSVNSREWQTQMHFALKGIYKPAGVYFIPRMADDNLGRWWHAFNIKIFKTMISRAVLFNEVDPNRIYMMGISQGGYGSCHLGPFMADHLAAVGPMAGGMMTVTENLRNLPFRSDIGENDTAYNRIKLAKELHAKLDEHKAKDPKGFVNELAIQKGRGHGIDYSKNPVWLAKHTRNPYPEKILWRCHQKQGLYADSFYWLSLSSTPEKGEYSITATINKKSNSVEITATEIIPPADKEKESTKKPLKSSDIIVHLNDKMLDLNKVVTIKLNGKTSFKGKVERNLSTMMQNLAKRKDINYAFPASIILKAK